ncbi:MAG TPA: DMT family transporter [Nocardioidaceae bacterium]|nr:DMT family transporter [Nocardioidaceae bacterium]
MTSSTRRGDAAAAGVLVVMWSSGFIGAELGTRFAPTDTLMAWRYVAAAVVLIAWAAARGIRPDRRTWPRLALVGLLCQCLYLGGVVTGVALGVPPGTAALVAALQPLVVAVAAAPLLGERTAALQRVGLVLGVVGVALVVVGDLGGGTAGLAAYALVVGGMLALSAGTVLERRLRLSVSLAESLTVQTLTATVFFLAVATWNRHLEPPADPLFWWSVCWVVALSTFGGYGSYLVVLRRSGATRVSTLLFLTPPATALWAYLMFGTRPALLALPGAVVCVVAVLLVLRRPRAQPARRSSGPPARPRARWSDMASRSRRKAASSGDGASCSART